MNISFIIPAFNCEKTLGESIDSILDTNMTNGDEIVIVNDGSTDSTSHVIDIYQKKHNFIQSHKNNVNKGGGATRNIAVRYAKNPLIFCLDADNILVPNSINKLKNYLIESDKAAVCFETIKFFKSTVNKITHERVFDKDKYDFSDYLTRTNVPGASGNYLYTKDAWEKAGGYPENAKAWDTWGFGLRMAASGFEIKVLKKSYYYHRYGNKSYYMRSVKQFNRSKEAFKILKPYINRLIWWDRLYLAISPFKYSWMERLNKHPLRLRGVKA